LEIFMRALQKTLAFTAAPLLLATPAFAAPAGRLAIGDIFGDAATPVQVVILLLLAAVVAAPLLLVLRRAEKLDVLAKGAPPLAAAACLFTLLAGSVGIANSTVVPTLTVLAPGIAESLLVLVLGTLASFSAVVCRELAKPRATT